MDLAKFLSLLDRSSLYFPRVDKLSTDDPFEGYYTKANVELEKVNFCEMPSSIQKSFGFDETVFESFRKFVRLSGPLAKAMRETTFVNSWHALGHESTAMWGLYVRSGDGIAIQSTQQSLIDCFSNYEDFNIHIGMIRYIDYEQDAIPIGQALFPCMHKRKNFEHEHELRAMIWTVEHGKNVLPFKNESINLYRDVPGLYVAVDLNALIQRIYVAPSSPEWIVDLLKSLVRRFGLDKEIVQSQLAEFPAY